MRTLIKLVTKASGGLLATLIACTTTVLSQPNIVLVMTDDQGYADLGCHGHPHLKTPHIDQLSRECVSLDDYHTFPTCSPSRASLMTGRWANRTGVWHTYQGKSFLRADETTLATHLASHGYATGIFGKWHLGDSYPFRPEDRGFTETFYHGGGGLGQTPDHWDNGYFDDHYWHNGKKVKTHGYSTDVVFQQAKQWIKQNHAQNKPFFAYISTTAPHTPLIAPQKYIDLYKDLHLESDPPNIAASLFGMISCIDDNVGAMRSYLRELGIADDTIFIFTTDNGSHRGAQLYNAGMRGRKGTEYEGGHRVPFFLHWPAGKLNTRRTISTLTSIADISPTLLELCKIKPQGHLPFDGLSLAPLFRGQSKDPVWNSRIVISDSQRVQTPIKWKQTSVMQNSWRLVNGTELYQLENDPGQRRNIAKAFPEKVQELSRAYDAIWQDMQTSFAKPIEPIIGHPKQAIVELTAHDWQSELRSPWHQKDIREFKALPPGETFDGYMPLRIHRSGTYTIRLARWPFHLKHPLKASLPAGADEPGIDKPFRAHPGIGSDINAAVITLNGKELARSPIAEHDYQASFKVNLNQGSQQFSTYFELADGRQVGAYFIEIEADD